MSSQLRDQHSEYTSHPMSQVAAQILDLNPSGSLSPVDTHELNAVLNIPAVLSATLPSELSEKGSQCCKQEIGQWG